MGKIKLGKSKESRTRGKTKAPLLSEEALQLKEQFKSGNVGFIDYLLNKGYSSTTISQHVRTAAHFTCWAKKENIPVEAAGYADVLHYIQGKKTQVKQRTLSASVNSIKHYFNFLAASGIMVDNPASQITIRGIKRRRLYDILKKKELENLYHNYNPQIRECYQNQNWYNKSQLTAMRNKLIVGLLVYQGLNTTEMRRLTKKDVKLREGKIFIAGTRRSNERELTLQSVQMLDMIEYVLKIREQILALSGKKSDKLIISTGTGKTLNNALQRLTKQLREINSKVSSLKQIRASVITHWLKVYNLREVQYMAGHRYVSSTENYLINDLDDLSEDISKYHPF